MKPWEGKQGHVAEMPISVPVNEKQVICKLESSDSARPESHLATAQCEVELDA